jgi:hypothetical protein
MTARAGKLLAIGSSTVVAVAIIAGLILTGSPAEQRLLRLDEQRVAHLRDLSNSISRHYVDTAALPDMLETLVDGRIRTSLPLDPATDRPYEYETAGPARFRLCAEFARESSPRDANDFWSHAAGRQCFEFDLSDLRLD